ncbi:MAG: poly-gamma-glutamate hydrolase family protein [Acidimicrobiales bacterium]
MTDVIASAAALASGASYYGVLFPDGVDHLPSTQVDPVHSPRLTAFLDHVEVVVTIHGFGRQGLFTSLLLGGGNRPLAHHVGDHLRRRLPAYRVLTDLEAIPTELRGQHPRNPVNRPPQQGVQIELPPRVRGSSPLWWDWEGPGPTPHTQALIDGLADAARSWDHIVTG